MFFADGPRQVINALTLFAIYLARKDDDTPWYDFKKYFKGNNLITTFCFFSLEGSGSDPFLVLSVIRSCSRVSLLIWCRRSPNAVDSLLRAQPKTSIEAQRTRIYAIFRMTDCERVPSGYQRVLPVGSAKGRNDDLRSINFSELPSISIYKSLDRHLSYLAQFVRRRLAIRPDHHVPSYCS